MSRRERGRRRRSRAGTAQPANVSSWERDFVEPEPFVAPFAPESNDAHRPPLVEPLTDDEGKDRHE